MAVEPERRCGFRQVGNTYLVGPALPPVLCHRLPWPLEGPCALCGRYVVQTRGIQWVEGSSLFGGNCAEYDAEWKEFAQNFDTQNFDLAPLFQTGKPHDCGHDSQFYQENLSEPAILLSVEQWEWRFACHSYLCPICDANKLGRVGLMWVGQGAYPTPKVFIDEAEKLGVCKVIPRDHVPTNLVLKKTWILLAHPVAFQFPSGEFGPAIFYAFRPERVEKIVTDRTTPEELESLTKRRITPIQVPADDPDHNPSLRKKKTKEAPPTRRRWWYPFAKSHSPERRR